MRRFLTCALAMTLFLSGCSKNNAAQSVFTQFRETLNGMETIALQAEVSADYGSYVFGCMLTFSWTKESDSAVVTVLEPESVAGIRAVLSEGEWQLGYDSVLLGAGDLDDRTFSPMTALYEMLCAWQSAPVSAACLDAIDGKEVVHITLIGEGDNNTIQDVWIERATFLPYTAEIAVDGKTVITARFIY